MLQTASVQHSSYSLRGRRKALSRSCEAEEQMADADDIYDEEGEGEGAAKGRSKSRRELPAGAVATLKAWLLSPEHFTHPYPTPQDQAMLMQKTGIDKKQLKNWFTNARRRIWKPMLKKQIEQGKLATTGPGMPGSVPGLMIPAIPGAPPTAVSGSMDNPHSVQAMRVHYQQAVQQQQQDSAQQQPQAQAASAPSDAYGNVVYSSAPSTGQYFASQPADSSGQTGQAQAQLTASASLGTLPQLSSSAQLSKTDSHAVLMELFARDQDLVRQATESARLKAESKQQPLSGAPASVQSSQTQQQVSNQHPMKAPSQSLLPTVPTLNSWPHFSSITSLNNLGTMPGVKSIASLSGADLASKGNVNKMGNLAQVKSMESMGKNDSYAFLEVFFGDRSSTNLSGMAGKDSKGPKMGGGEEDNEIGLSLEDESPSQTVRKDFGSSATPAAPQPAPATSTTQESGMDSGMIKRAYDDALAARGLISVSRSCEKLTDLVLPAKIQRTLSQEFINKQQQMQTQTQSQQYGQYSYAPEPSPSDTESAPTTSHQYPGQHPGEPSATGEEDGHVQVPSTTTCALCHQTNVDTQLRPCGHMYHERCLKPSLRTPMGPPTCPVDNIPMQSALLAVPTDDPVPPAQSTQSASWSYTPKSQSTETQGS